MDDTRVKYYESNDIFYGYNLSKIESLEIPSFDAISINDAIEYFEIKRYFEKGTRSKDWTDKQYCIYKEKSNKLYDLTMRFINCINDDSIIEQHEKVDENYSSSFWSVFDICKLYNNISSNVFEQLIYTSHIAPFDLFSYKNIVDKYGDVLKRYLLENDFTIRIILHFYEQNYEKGTKKLHIPKDLSGEDIVAYFDSYIDSGHVNNNYLDEIIHMKFSKQFPVSDELKLKAKRRYDQEIENMSRTGVHIQQGIQLEFSQDQTVEKNIKKNDNDFCITYGTKWLLETLDYASILNNFIYIFEFADVPQMRCLHVSKKGQAGIFERMLQSKSSLVYPVNTVFRSRDVLATMQMAAYYHFLQKKDIRLEEVLQWFFTEYLHNEFGCTRMRLSFPSEGATYAEKCSTIITVFESAIKQFTQYVKHRKIDFELLAMSSSSVKIEDIPCMTENKYLYGIGCDYQWYTYWLFSDQCIFSYVQRIEEYKRNYNTFFELLKNEKVYLTDYHEKDRLVFLKMEEADILRISLEGLITLGNPIKLFILKDLYDNEVISHWHYPKKAQPVIDELINNGIVEVKSSLLSEPEGHYFNYVLNNSEYCNGLAIRNKYAHGIQQAIDDDEFHKQNYLILLRLFVILAIKINDDFCLADEQRDSNFYEQD
ncbi:hypothetical protein [Anaerosporobacter faecicola]|uniref:hypothetical protein n=1 Tax=Anaerosporobacter faecicola TaxID=2718714 RepID=UPI00143C1FF1|nr:hypothetical protein [Anaerosporobacter faecicola]